MDCWRALRRISLEAAWHIRQGAVQAFGFIVVTVVVASIPLVLYCASRLQNIILDDSIQFNYEITFLQGGDGSLLLHEMEKPLLCRHMMYHAASSPEYLNDDSLLIRRQLEWIQAFPDDCFVTFAATKPSPILREPTSWRVWDRINKYRSKFDVQSILTSLAMNGMLKQPDSSEPPWLLFTDVDILPMNKNKSISSLIARVDRGMRRLTTEERLCIEEPKVFKCPASRRPETIDQIGYVIALDQNCFDDWMYNIGSYLYKPSRLSGFMSSAVLWTLNDTSMPHHFDQLEQGRNALLLREVFDLHPDVTRRLCGYPFEMARWNATLEADEIVFIRRLNLQKALVHPQYRVAAQMWFPEGRFWPGEPTSVAVVASRWMNSPACNVINGFSKDRREIFQYHCGDMFAHFNGCKKEEYFWSTFRTPATEEAWCRRLIPFKTNDGGDGPFDVVEWVAAANKPKPYKLASEPTSLLQYGH